MKIFNLFVFIFLGTLFYFVWSAESLSEPLKKASEKLSTYKKEKPYNDFAFQVIISIKEQKLYLMNDQNIIKTYPISSAKNGLGNEENSYKTPIGTLRVAEKIGENGPINGIYIDRKYTGEQATIYLDETDAETDYITTRILWLEGLEESNKNTKQRYIYIHGTHEEGLIGKPVSHGCIRMKNKDVVELFEFVPLFTLVEIVDDVSEKI